MPRVFFVIVPTRELGRSEYFRRTEERQVGSLTCVFRDYLGVRVRLRSPLATADWPYDTRMGKHLFFFNPSWIQANRINEKRRSPSR